MRGLYDAEKQIVANLWAGKQFADQQFVELFSGDSKSISRRVSYGRIAVNFSGMESNLWLQSSELCVSGRAIGPGDAAPIAPLPKHSEILQPVSESPDRDIMVAERVRPSVEQTAAQKGSRRDEIMFQSLFTGVNLPGPALVVNLTGHVEDTGSADARHRIASLKALTQAPNDINEALRALLYKALRGVDKALKGLAKVP